MTVKQVDGWYGQFGGQYVPETLVAALEQLLAAWNEANQDTNFHNELNDLLTYYVARPTPLTKAVGLTELLGGATVWLKREDLAHTGAHKINNTLGQALLAKRMGKDRIIAETGAGQHGVATATACAKLGLQCEVYMGAEDVRRQSLNVFRMELLGARVNVVDSGSKTLKDATNEAMRDWVDPCNNYVFVDVYGDIRYLNRGKVPIRSMDNAWLPVPGWDGDHEWSGYIPFDELPRSTNPENGFIVTANNRIVDEDYPYYIALEYAPEYRSRRIIERVLGLGKATVEDMVAIHSERTSIPALVYMDILKEVVPSGSVEESAKKILIEWNGVMDSDSTAATIYSAFRLKLHDRVFQNLFGSLAGEALIAGGRGAPRHVSQLASNLVTDADFRNESLLPEGETWESIVPKAFSDGILWLIDILGEDVSSWEWGRVHHTNPVHPLSEYHPDLSKKLDPPSVAMGGDGDTCLLYTSPSPRDRG